jgi:hypothetical protein
VRLRPPMEDLDKLILKALLLAFTAPAWYPFLKAVWEEFNQALAEDGGIFGRNPTHLELKDIEREKLERPDPLVHEPWLTSEQRLAGRHRMGRGPKPNQSKSPPRPAKGPLPRRGF